MNLNIIGFLITSGLVNGSAYLLAGLGLVLIFSVTRVIFIPFGDIAVYAAFSVAAFEAGKTPATIIAILLLAAIALLVEIGGLLKRRQGRRVPKALLLWGGLPLIPCGIAWVIAIVGAPHVVQLIGSVFLVLPMAPLLGRAVFQPIADASVLVLFIVALALEFVISGAALFFFGADGIRTNPLVTGSYMLSGVPVSMYAITVIAVAVVVSLVFFLLFQRTKIGTVLRAASVNRIGARLVGIRPARASMFAYATASLLAGIIGVLIAPETTLYYNSGFLIGLKSFVAAIIGGLVSYPITAVGAMGVGLLESFAGFWSGAFQVAIVFAALIPILLVRSALTGGQDEHTEEVDE